MTRELPGPSHQSLYDFASDALPLPPGESAYRRGQLRDWLYVKGAGDFAAMTSLPGHLREWLARSYVVEPFAASERHPSEDGSVRYLFTLHDGQRTEAVYMPYSNRRTVCLSSMVGCPAGCSFCATGAMGFGRNLTRGEIVGQLLAVARGEGIEPRSLRNAVLMGMGEALLNYDNAVGAIRTMLDPQALGMSPRRVTLSTVGLASRMKKLAEEGLPLVLAVSLHAPDEETRRRIIPTAHAQSIGEIIDALKYWQERIGRRVTIEYTMLDGVNDAPWQARTLVKRLHGLKAHVNLIPFNAWPGSEFAETPAQRLEEFEAILASAGVSVSVRFSRGRDAGGACGQLALQAGRPDALPMVSV
ncbi:MAG TPA: 23S rRNA (adenine(2503)-C(2))-methyltransferase RlmN [Trueperaceae bacterium]|nr:23S rRNA (adenine(2503)-C(2))-methyltransferase RlmN [Trueperaceae bacterium]